MYRKNKITKSRTSRNTVPAFICFFTTVLLLAFAICGITASAETESVTDPAIGTSPFGFFSDVPDPPLTGETEIVYEETHHPIRRVDIASVSTPKGKPQTEAEPSADTLPQEEPVTEYTGEAETPTQTAAPTQTLSESGNSTEQAPLMSLPAVAAIGSVLAVMSAITVLTIAIRLRKSKKTDPQPKTKDEKDSAASTEDSDN